MSEAPHIENFAIISQLGRGGMATVWKARQSSLDRLVAIKVLSSAFATDPADIARFREEARAAGRLKHSGIVQVYDANFTNGIYYFVMELVDGYTVGEWIRRKGRLNENDALTIAESVIAALDYAWTNFGIIHCDIKPENIMIDADGTVKITDLGLSRAIVSMHSNQPEQEILGTPAYMSPEQVSGQPDLDCRADIYALGAMIYHMVTGHPLFAGQGTDDEIMQKQLVGTVQNPAREVPDLSHGFVLLLTRLLAKERNDRPQDWKAVMADIRRARDRRTQAWNEPLSGASTIFLDADELAAEPWTAEDATAHATPAGGPVGGVWKARLLFPTFLLLAAGGLAVWWFALGGSWPFTPPASASPAVPSADDRCKAVLTYVADHPADLAGGIKRLDAALVHASDSRVAQQARAQRDRLRMELAEVLQAIYKNLDAQAHDLAAHNRGDEALRLLEKYQGPCAAETAAWRLEHAQRLRGQMSPPTPTTPAAAPVPAP